ncbi:hypothetical protein ACFQZC_06595 [Streptacidiphilus monticola]
MLRTDPTPNTGATSAIASMAYRDSEVEDLINAVTEPTNTATLTTWTEGRAEGLFKPNLGEAFCQAVLKRTLGAGRKPLVPSYGAQPRIIIEHCLEAQEIRKVRDRRLTWISWSSACSSCPVPRCGWPPTWSAARARTATGRRCASRSRC